MADLMSDAPAKVLAAFVFAFRRCLHRYGLGKARYGSPLDSDMQSVRIHKCTCKHPLVAQIQPANRQFIFHSGIGITAQSLVLVEEIYHLIGRRQRLIQLLRLFLRSSA